MKTPDPDHYGPADPITYTCRECGDECLDDTDGGAEVCERCEEQTNYDYCESADGTCATDPSRCSVCRFGSEWTLHPGAAMEAELAARSRERVAELAARSQEPLSEKFGGAPVQAAPDPWIAVGDRLPDDDLTVLAYADGDSEPVLLAYVDTVDGTDGQPLVEWRTVEGALATDADDDGWGPVTHWMPIPAPPGGAS